MATNRNIAVVDVETTGISAARNDRVVEIAVILMTPTGTILEEYETLINPQRDIGPTRIHKLTSTDVLDAPVFSDIAGDVAALLSQAMILAGHNISFDHQFLTSEMHRASIEMPLLQMLCSCQLLGRRNLAACCEEFGIAFQGNAHCAKTDALATAELLAHLISQDSSILENSKQDSPVWPAFTPKMTPCVTRQTLKSQRVEEISFLQRLTKEMRHDTEAALPNELAYLTLIDRVLEDRIIDREEEEALLDAVQMWGLSSSQLNRLHETYIHNLSVRALADGVVSDAERRDLHSVAKLLGYDDTKLDEVLAMAMAQIESSGGHTPSRSTEPNLSGSKVCFTGELLSTINGEPIKRPIAENLAENAGLTVLGNVTKKLDILVVADPNTQSGKARKARQYGTRIIAEPVFWEMIGVKVD